MRFSTAAATAIALCLTHNFQYSSASRVAFVSTTSTSSSVRKISTPSIIPTSLGVTSSDSGDAPTSGGPPTNPILKAPTLNGKMVLPLKVIMSGLNGSDDVAAVYAVVNSQHKRGGDGWEQCEYVGVTRNLAKNLQAHLTVHGSSTVAHVRALTFAYPQKAAMEDVANIWRGQAAQAGGNAAVVAASGEDAAWKVSAAAAVSEAAEEEKVEEKEEDIPTMPKDMADVLTATFDDDDDYDDDDDFDDYMMEQALAMERMRSSGAAELSSNLDQARDSFAAARGGASTLPEKKAEPELVISPFSSAGAAAASEGGEGGEEAGPLVFNKETVDKILDEVRPYLIQDGGNVSVQRVEEETKNVYLILEGACGSCPSSTVTMQMGIERILRENFSDLGEVVAVDTSLDGEGGDANPTELTLRAVEEELSRIKPAILAMGGAVEIVSVDPIGVVELQFRGSNKVQQGLELAIRDVKFVKHVKFIS
mmetsp:Transcript_2120/g.3253  ORF Transcript_2120/g.3253 Transcript_2120/m.3253 type:complete len:479 (+) Transcript_2120:111-1547(+)